MKALAKTVAAAICVIAVAASASPHAHRHMHSHNKKRGASPDTEVVTVPGTPEVVYQFEHTTITESEVCQGILNGTFVWAEGTTDKPKCAAVKDAPPAAPAPSPAASPVSLKQDIKQDPPADKPASKVASPIEHKGPSTDNKDKQGPSAPPSGGSGDSSEISGGGDCEKEFQSGVHDCTEFPEQYGAVKIPWMNLGGWSGVQFTKVANGVVGNIDTAVGGGGCKAGAFCSYACPPGYQKSQWPDQSSGTSVGGLLCGDDGKLHLSNPSVKTICMKGTGKAQVQNKLSGKNVAICRTDYPGKRPFIPVTFHMTYLPFSTRHRVRDRPAQHAARPQVPAHLPRRRQLLPARRRRHQRPVLRQPSRHRHVQGLPVGLRRDRLRRRVRQLGARQHGRWHQL